MIPLSEPLQEPRAYIIFFSKKLHQRSQTDSTWNSEWVDLEQKLSNI